MKTLAWSIFYLLLFAHVSAGELLDVETLPCHRTKQYPLAAHKQIIVFSAPRTGSSVVYNVFRFLFEDDSLLFSHHNEFTLDRLVLKTHKFLELERARDEDDVLYIFTLRNPLHACISNYRICPRKITDNQAFAKELAERHQHYLLSAETMAKEGKDVAILKYEDFADDLGHLFDCIENRCQLAIREQDKELMRKGYSKSNIDLCTRHLASFNEYLPISGFHGKHINVYGYTPPDDFLYWLNVYLEDAKPLFGRYGY